MTLQVLPLHLASHQWSFPNHRADGTTLTLCNSSGTCQNPASSLFFPSSTYGNHTIPLELRPKGNFNRKLLANASVKRNDESSRGSSKPSTEEELLKSILLASGNSPASQNSDFEVVESDPKTEVNPNYDVFDYSENQGTLDKLKAVHLHVLALEQWNASRLQLCHRDYVDGATNLIHYLALKGLDIEHLKKELSSIGLHNLDTNNSHILASITMGIQILQLLNFYSLNDRENLNSLELNNTKDSTSTLQHLSPSSKQDFTITKMRTKATLHQELLLGRLRDGRTSHIMVTVGKEAIENETLVSDLLRGGATTIRINCAHGDPSVWSEIISRVRTSSQMLEKPCRILMDLAGPKLRTGDMGTGPSVIKISPKKDASGNVILPAEVWLSHTESGPPPAHLSPDAALSIDNHQVLKMLELGSVLRFHDARGKLRLLKISKKFPVFGGVGCVAECTKTAYVESGTALYTKGKKRKLLVGRVVNVPGVEQFIRVRVGDSLIISRDPCLIPRNGASGSTVDAPRITCSSSHLFDSVKPGEPIAFDDGKIWGVIQGTSTSEIIVSITHANPKGSKLGSEKSINIPKSDIRFEGLTSKDLVDLDFVASHADMVGISFVRDVRDVVVVQKELEKRKLEKLGVILKIETQSGFENLPLLLLQAMRSPNPLGIMIARGDLAVECGWEALADIQEEIMSICNAALIPVIWATQVLESLVKSGLPTRAEITDVACGKRASCIMLNKGKCIVEAVSALDAILDTSSSKIKTKLKPLVLSSHP